MPPDGAAGAGGAEADAGGAGGFGGAGGAAGAPTGDGGTGAVCEQPHMDRVWATVTAENGPMAVEAIAPGEVWGTTTWQLFRWNGTGWDAVPAPFAWGTNGGLVRGSVDRCLAHVIARGRDRDRVAGPQPERRLAVDHVPGGHCPARVVQRVVAVSLGWRPMD